MIIVSKTTGEVFKNSYVDKDGYAMLLMLGHMVPVFDLSEYDIIRTPWQNGKTHINKHDDDESMRKARLNLPSSSQIDHAIEISSCVADKIIMNIIC